MDGDQPVCELDANPGAAHIVKRINTFGANGLISRDRIGSTDELYTYDPQGNVAQITDASGAVTVSLQADAFGLMRASDGSTSTQPGSGSLRAYGFGGQWGYAGDGEDGLILCTHRFYDPNNGRWLTRDPMGFGGGVNLYGYCKNNPINGNDPDGYACIMDVNPGTPFTGYSHAYIQFNLITCSGSNSAGFWGPPDGSGGNMPKPGHGILWPARGEIKCPDPRASGPHKRKCAERIDSVAFELALCACITASKAHTPEFCLPGYVCGTWVHDIWACAKKKCGMKP